MRIIWTLGLVVGLVTGAVVLTDVPLLIKLLIGVAVVMIGVAGAFGSVLLAGLLLGAGLLTFVVLLATSEPAAVASALGVATLLIASGVAFSFRELFRDRRSSTLGASSVSRKALADRTAREPGARIGQHPDENSEEVSSSLDDLAESVRVASNESD
jgi:hypothetical protein